LNRIIGLSSGGLNPALAFNPFTRLGGRSGGYETMHMIRKGQVEGVKKGDVKNQIKFIENLFELAT